MNGVARWCCFGLVFFLGFDFSAKGQVRESGGASDSVVIDGFEPPFRSTVLEKARIQNSRLLNESMSDHPFMPESRNPLRDPMTGDRYSGVLYGPVMKSRNPFANYTYWRNVTLYRVSVTREEIADLPSMHQSCFDGGHYPIGNWQVSRSISVDLRSSLKCGDLGLGAEVSLSVSQGRTFSIQRALIVPAVIEADYVPVFRHDSWDGITFIQTYEPLRRQLGFIPPTVWDLSFGSYPYSFALKNVATVFEVERRNARKCATGKKEKSKQLIPDVYIPLN